MRSIELPTYAVMVEEGALGQLPQVVRDVAPRHRVVVITDDVVLPLHAARAAAPLSPAAILHVPAGEQAKNRDTWSRLTDEMLAHGLGRDTVVVAIGGGVVGDIAGFVAATYMRGIPIVQVPTTLLAMVDASVGGKTGVDTPAGKNLVGAFHPPAAVVVDPEVLETLPREHLRAGFAEIVKHGVVADEEYFRRAATFAPSLRVTGELTELIARSIEIKAAIVTKDEREAGLRKVLNFGHTIGHAIEAATDYRTLHGHAVAIGLVSEARMAERLGVAAAGTARAIEHACRDAGLPTQPPEIAVDELLAYTRADKKARAGRVEYALPARIGAMAGAQQGWAIPVDDAIVREALAR